MTTIAQERINYALSTSEAGIINIGILSIEEWKDLEIPSEYRKRAVPPDQRWNLVLRWCSVQEDYYVILGREEDIIDHIKNGAAKYA